MLAEIWTPTAESGVLMTSILYLYDYLPVLKYLEIDFADLSLVIFMNTLLTAFKYATSFKINQNPLSYHFVKFVFQ